MTPPLEWRGTKKPLDESERGEWKSWLKVQHSENGDHGIWSHHFMAIDGETVETVSDFIFWGFKTTADGDCSHEIKRHLLLAASLVAQKLKLLPAVWETWVRSLGWEDPLEREMAMHSSILAWRISWMEEPGRLQSMGSQRVRHDWATLLSLLLGRKVMTNLDSIFKSRDITLPTKVCLVKAMVFPVVMCGCES